MTTSSAAKSRTKSRTPETLITPNSAGSNSATISSSFFKSVYLEDWWLMKAQGKGLAVGGFSCSETQEVRLFSSAAIATRHDITTLGTSDGFQISVSGFINRPRTLENGFPSEVCNRFLLGFPYEWEEYAALCCGEKFSDGCAPKRRSAFDKFSMSSGDKGYDFLPGSLDDVPVTRTRDLLMSTLDDCGNSVLTKSIFDDILEKLGREPLRNTGDSVNSKMDGNDLKVDSAQDDTPSNHKKAKVRNKSKDRNALLNAKDSRTKSYKNSNCPNQMDMDAHTVNSSVATRSMTRQMCSRNNQEDLSLNTSARKGISDLPSSSEVAGNQHQGRITRSSSNMSRAATLLEEKKEAKKIPDKSAIRRSSIKQKNLATNDL